MNKVTVGSVSVALAVGLLVSNSEDTPWLIVALKWIGGRASDGMTWLRSDSGAPWWVVLCLVPLGAALFYGCAYLHHRFSERNQSESVPKRVKVALDDDSRLLLCYLLERDGEWISLDEAMDALGLRRLQVERAMSVLLMHRLVTDRHNYLHGTGYRATPSALDYSAGAKSGTKSP